MLNLLPIAFDGAMPVVRDSREVISAQPIDEPELLSAKHTELDLELGLSNPLAWLSDWIPVPGLSAVISIGDVLLAAAFIAIGLSARADARRVQAAPNAPNNATDGSLETIAR